MKFVILHVRSFLGISTKPSKVDINKFSVEEILDKADEFIEQYNYEMAQKFLERALEINSDHPRALETAASLLLEVYYLFLFSCFLYGNK